MVNPTSSSKTKEDLFKLAKQEISALNTDKKVITVLRKHGIEGQFDPNKWEDYVNVLEIEKLSRLDEANSKTRARLVASIQSHLSKGKDGRIEVQPVEKCTVCGAKAIREPKYDNRFGLIVGWRCSETPGHSMLEGWSRLLKYITDNREQRLSEIEQFAKEQIDGNTEE